MKPADASAPLAVGRAAIALAHREDERSSVLRMLQAWDAGACDAAAIERRAAQLVRVARGARSASGVAELMQAFPLSSPEGAALTCLAEALLRIPDEATRMRLLRDKVGAGDWRIRPGGGRSPLLEAASRGLRAAAALLAAPAGASSGIVRGLARRAEPAIRRGVEIAVRRLGRQFVIGETIEEALARSAGGARRCCSHSFDMLGEAALTAADAQRYAAAYAHAIDVIGRGASTGVVAGPSVSVKLSALHPRFSRAQRGRVHGELYPRLCALARRACEHDMGFSIDAEEADRLEISLDLVERLAFDPVLAGWEGLGIVVQAYQKRALPLVAHIVALARLRGCRLMVRLVKGAYWDGEIKRAQMEGLDFPVFTRKAHTDLSYLVCAARLLDAADIVYPQFATHNAHTVAAVERMAAERGVAAFEFQRLHGMGEALFDQLAGADGRRCRIYAPVGRHDTLLPYLVRRLIENAAGSSFVHRLVDPRVPAAELAADPLAAVRAECGMPHPAIPPARALYGAERDNANGIDFADDRRLRDLGTALRALAARAWQARPLLAEGAADGAGPVEILNPARRAERVGIVHAAGAADVARALAAAQACTEDWHREPAARRARLLRACADRLEAHREELMSLAIREAGKTWPNALGEVREAVDHCRYCAARLERLPAAPSAPGIAVAISPWNFPLAIFVGQVAAALAAGSPVIAKPAAQTPLLAARAVALFHEAGIAPAALQLLPGSGETVGAALTADARVRTVLFTGSTSVAKRIERSLAARPADAPETRLIAETGGQNAMIVDASALPEQVVQDVLSSAFDSAGQRCSALRVLCLQQDIAERVLDMLRGAMQELRIGDPARLSTDIGPVIDEAARGTLEAHVERMAAAGCRVWRCTLPAEAAGGLFVPPTLVEIRRMEDLRHEVFGPVLHVLRFPAQGVDALLAAIEATGYGLTFGLHSRIDAFAGHVLARVRAGNLYLNRSMIGAVVGVQPFGGEGLSGTGPKAGGPLYLPRLMGLDATAPEALGLDASNAPALPTAFDALADWARHRAPPALAAACAAYAQTTPAGREAALPGPAGERNTLHFRPCGAVLCRAPDAATLLAQLAAVLATGNTAVIEGAEAHREALAALPEAVRAAVECVAPGAPHPVAAILFAGDAAGLAQLRRETASREGAIVPVIVAGPDGRYPLHRLVRERVVTVNTAAAGGDAALVSLPP